MVAIIVGRPFCKPHKCVSMLPCCKFIILRAGVKRRTPRIKTSETSTKTAAATTNKEVVRYASGTVQMGSNVTYEGIECPEEAIYEHPT